MGKRKQETPDQRRIRELEVENAQLRMKLDPLLEEPIPKIHTLWMEMLPNGEWRYSTDKSGAPGALVYGPYLMVPGILPLGELTKYGVWISYDPDRKRWCAREKSGRTGPPVVYPLEAQWAATRIARKKVQDKIGKRGRHDERE